MNAPSTLDLVVTGAALVAVSVLRLRAQPDAALRLLRATVAAIEADLDADPGARCADQRAGSPLRSLLAGVAGSAPAAVAGILDVLDGPLSSLPPEVDQYHRRLRQAVGDYLRDSAPPWRPHRAGGVPDLALRVVASALNRPGPGHGSPAAVDLRSRPHGRHAVRQGADRR